MKPLLTIGLLTREDGDRLTAALQSAFIQDSTVPYEVLVISEAGQSEIAACLNEIRHPSYRHITVESETSEADLRNRLVGAAESELILWLDENDILHPLAVEKIISAAQERPGSEIIYSRYRFSNEELLLSVRTPAFGEIEERGEDLFFFDLMSGLPSQRSGVAIRRSLWERLGFFSEEQNVKTSADFLLRAVEDGCEFTFIEKPLYHFRSTAAGSIKLDALYAEEQSRITTRVLAAVPIEQIYTMFDWKHAPETAAAKALLISSLIYLKWNDLDSAKEAFQQSRAFFERPECTAIEALIHRAAGDTEAAADVLVSVLLRGGECGELPQLLQLAEIDAKCFS